MKEVLRIAGVENWELKNTKFLFSSCFGKLKPNNNTRIPYRTKCPALSPFGKRYTEAMIAGIVPVSAQ
jgi:hypothetical protein